MKWKQVWWIMPGVLMATMVAGVAQYKTDSYFARDEQALLKVERQWAEALEREDAAALEKILAPEYTMVDAIGVTANRSETINQVRSGALKFDAFSTSEVKVRVFQGGGVVTGRAKTKGKFQQTDISGDYYFVDVFQYNKDGWKAVFTQLTKIEQKK